jgi:hypothetical protein
MNGVVVGCEGGVVGDLDRIDDLAVNASAQLRHRLAHPVVDVRRRAVLSD